MHALHTSYLARRLEHTLLKPDATGEAVQKLCAEAQAHHFYGVCVNGVHIARCAKVLKGTDVKLVCVVGFPFGACTATTKAFEAHEAVVAGADEIDMVMNVGALKAGQDEVVQADIEAVVAAARGRVVKVIVETSLLELAQLTQACRLCVLAGAHFVKTSTGFGARGASVEDVMQMRATVGPNMGIKASGGIRTRAAAEALVAAGADRLGVSASIALVEAPIA